MSGPAAGAATQEPDRFAWMHCYRPALNKSGVVRWRGVDWLLKTNGHVFFAIVRPEGEGQTHPIADKILTILNGINGESMTVSLAPLRDFLRGMIPAVKCASCGDRGGAACTACEGHGYEDCQCDCGDVHDKKCGKCKGVGQHPCLVCGLIDSAEKIPRTVTIRGVVPSRFDAAKLAQILDHIPGDTASWQQEGMERVAFLSGDGWMAGVMPMRPDNADGVYDLAAGTQ